MNHFLSSSFWRHEAFPGILLFIAAAVAIALANSPLRDAFTQILHSEIGFGAVRLDVAHWVQDGLMALFFLFVSLELKRELVAGVLAKPKQAALPVIASIGGTVVPALFYLAFNAQSGYAHGWAIPAATDIAFSLGVLSLLGNRVPNLLKVFLLALAIVDDMGAVLIIAIGYTASMNTGLLSMAVALTALMLLMGKLGVRRLEVYWIAGFFLWLALLHSGMHATIAGVITAFAIPFDKSVKRHQPLLTAEHVLRPWVQFLVMPLFALCFAGIPFGDINVGLATHPVTLGVAAGLLLGKPLGIIGACVVFRHTTGSKLQLPWPKLWGVALLAGIGFTMSLFMGSLSLGPVMADQVRLGVYAASILAGIAGWALLYKTLPRQGHKHAPSPASPFLTRE